MARVLVIDDEPHVRAAVSIALKMKGFEVVAVEGGRMGLSEQEKSSFDLVIVDVYMPNMDGIQFIKALRQRRPNLPIIVMSGVLYRGTGGSALDVLPMAPHLTDIVSLQKPFRPKQLLQAVQNAMGIVAAQ
jgi:DNA-binding NtrC family response regulator